MVAPREAPDSPPRSDGPVSTTSKVGSALMTAVVAKLTIADMVAMAAYTASLAP
jgi:hypothetical protein